MSVGEEPDSVPVSNDKCTSHNSHQCINCPQNQHYDIKREECVKNLCQCPYGNPVQECAVHNAFDCRLDSCHEGEIEYVSVETSLGMDCVHPCTNKLTLDDLWFSPTEEATKHWLLHGCSKGIFILSKF